jgi:hypothetical protein
MKIHKRELKNFKTQIGINISRWIRWNFEHWLKISNNYYKKKRRRFRSLLTLSEGIWKRGSYRERSVWAGRAWLRERGGEREEGACTWKLFGIWGFFKFWKPVDGGVLLPPSFFFFFLFFSLLFSGSISYNALIIELIYESSDYLLLLN